ncbi:unnamed protein product [Sphagnum jensenii]|uniref:Uncharacterized protein n=1 Tax=Sphagnum jensenii TaxID=128206 RepID=A0ABP1BY62_9BRYO
MIVFVNLRLSWGNHTIVPGKLFQAPPRPLFSIRSHGGCLGFKATATFIGRLINLEVYIPLARYMPTWKGKIVESDAEMSAACVTVMALSLTAEGGPEGREQGPEPFRLELDWIKALRVT